MGGLGFWQLWEHSRNPIVLRHAEKFGKGDSLRVPCYWLVGLLKQEQRQPLFSKLLCQQ